MKCDGAADRRTVRGLVWEFCAAGCFSRDGTRARDDVDVVVIAPFRSLARRDRIAAMDQRAATEPVSWPHSAIGGISHLYGVNALRYVAWLWGYARQRPLRHSTYFACVMHSAEALRLASV
jgi:hypothetical protein